MVEVSDVDSCSAYSTSSSSSRKPSKNLSGLSCFARDGSAPCRSALAAKKSNQSDSDSDADDGT
jgi:hypothetical protein